MSRQQRIELLEKFVRHHRIDPRDPVGSAAEKAAYQKKLDELKGKAARKKPRRVSPTAKWGG